MQHPLPFNLSSDIPRGKVTDHCKMDVKQRHDLSDGVSFITPWWGRISCAWAWCCFCNSKITLTLQMLQRCYWWVGLDQSVRWWIRRCLFCQARKTSRQTIRWSTTLMPLPSGPGQIVSVDYFGPLPITRKGNKHILLFTDKFSPHIAAYAVTQDERTAEGTARIFVEQYIPLWGCPHTLLSDNGSEFVARLSLAIYKLMRIRNIATTAFHPKSNGGVERVNHSLAQMLSLVISEQQDDWDEWLP